MLDETLPLTLTDREEFGNPLDEVYYRHLKSISPYHNVTAQRYPHVLLIVGMHDTRVQFWEALKMAAKLRELKLGDSIVLLRAMDSGHFGGTGDRLLREAATKFAWLLRQLQVE